MKTRRLRHSFDPLPKRSYDLNTYSSYPCSVMDKRRETAPSWHCFIVYDDEIMLLISELIGKHHDCECYRKDIFDTDFIDDLNREEIDYDSAR